MVFLIVKELNYLFGFSVCVSHGQQDKINLLHLCGLADFKDLIRLITSTVDKFNANIPGIQKHVLEEVLLLAKQLDMNGANVRISTTNLKIIADVKARLQKIILNEKYLKNIGSYVKKFDEITTIQNSYFQSVEKKFNPSSISKELLKQAKNSVVHQLTGGIDTNISEGIKDILRKGITGGSSYASMQKQLTDYLTDNQSGEGQLQRYVKQISTDAINQFSGQYTQVISSDLGFEWFRYSGSNLITSRLFCLACTDRKYFHISELPKILKGEFEEFRQRKGKINVKTGLPNGMIPGTDVSNYMTNRGGYNCGHQWRPVSEDLVPAEIKQRVFASAEYKAWKGRSVPTPDIKAEKPIAKQNKIGRTIDLDSEGSSLKLDITGGLATVLIDLVNRGRKVITNIEKKQLISLNDLKERKSVKDGGKLYSTQNQIILDHEQKIIDKLLKLKNDILFMPDYFFGSGKKFDVLVFKGNSYYKADLKHFISKNVNTITKEIIKGRKQAPNLIIDFNNSTDHAIISDAMNAALRQTDLTSIKVIYKGKTKTYYKDQILSKKFPVMFYNDFVR